MSLPCGANVDFNAITDATSDLKTKLTSQLGGNFTSASALKDAVSANITSVSANLSNMLPAIPEVPKLNFQSELTALAGINLSTPQGVLDYQSKLSSITENFGSALSGAGFSLDDLVAQAAPALSTATDALSGALDPSASASSLINDAISEASSVASSLSSVVSGGASFDICKDCPNFELEAGATEAVQVAQETILSSSKGFGEELKEFTANVDFGADVSALTTKASNILARPEVQAKISSDIASAQEQQSADIQGAITDVTAAAQPIIKEVTPVLEELSGKSLSTKLPKNINIPKNLFRK